MGVLGFVLGFELFPALMVLAGIGLIVAGAAQGPNLYHMLVWWEPGLVGVGIPLLALLMVRFLWRDTDTKNDILPWLYATTLFFGPLYLYIGYFLLPHPVLLFFGFGILTLVVGIYVIFAPIAVVALHFNDTKEYTQTAKLLGYSKSEWYKLPREERNDLKKQIDIYESFWENNIPYKKLEMKRRDWYRLPLDKRLRLAQKVKDKGAYLSREERLRLIQQVQL